MENKKCRKNGLRFYTAEEKKQRKTDYMLNKPWYCEICNTGRNYSLAGKWSHLGTKKHHKNLFAKKKTKVLK